MADIEHRQLVAERMQFQFLMTELDAEGNPIRTVTVALDCTDGQTHDEITEAYQNFMSGCGYVFDGGEIRYVRRGE